MRRIHTLVLALVAAAVPLACSAQDAPVRFKENVHYKQVRDPQDVTVDGKVQVAEVFWYGCSHCYRFDPIVEKWKNENADRIEFVRLPSSLGREQAKAHSRAYYTAEALGVLDQVHLAMFRAIHERGRSLYSVDEIAKVFEDAADIDRATFEKTFKSFGVESRVQRAEALIRSYGIPSVPTLVVDGTYWTNGRYAGNFQGMTEVADFLVAQQR